MGELKLALQYNGCGSTELGELKLALQFKLQGVLKFGDDAERRHDAR